MSAEQTTSLMQRKARSARDAQVARTMSLGRALRLTAGKQAELLMGLALNTLGVTRKKIDATSVSSLLGDRSLMLLLDGPDNQVGAAVLDAAMVQGLLQQQIMGKIKGGGQEGDMRPYTATDAALCAPFIETLLAQACVLPEEEADRKLLKGYRFGVWAKEPRQVELVMDAPGFEAVEVTFDMAAGTSTGKLTLILPYPERAIPKADPEGGATQATAPSANLSGTVLGLHAELTIALTRLRLPLQNVTSLKAGDLLDLNLSSMAQALIVDGNGRVISRGTLGQIDGMRAVQVEQDKTKHHSQPRRRATDRAELDLPDVTRSPGENEAGLYAGEVDFMDVMGQAEVPSLSDIDVFGNLDDLPDLPDMDEAAHAADAKMADYDPSGEYAEDDDRRTQAV
jgi:flagellar motor switch/type III secretory pathway protein FliN